MNSTTSLRVILFILASGYGLAMTGCSNPARDRMIGKWEASFEMTEDDMAQMTPTDNPVVAGLGKLLMKSLRAEIEWTFAADNTATATATLLGNTITRQGTWTFLSGDETTTKLLIEFDGDESHEVSFSFSGPDTFEAAPMANTKYQLNRIVKFKRVPPLG